MASAVNALGGYASASDTSTGKTSGTESAATKEMFLQLLVAQIKNQDPLNPTDSVQFVSQLAQFSELEQVIAIRGDVDNLAGVTGTDSTTADGTDTVANN
jgi:flagellar basal-body rod modification protein FlgD